MIQCGCGDMSGPFVRATVTTTTGTRSLIMCEDCDDTTRTCATCTELRLAITDATPADEPTARDVLALHLGLDHALDLNLAGVQ